MSALLIVVAGGAAWYIRDLQHTVADMLANNVSSMRAAQELEIDVRELRTQVDRYLISGDPKHLESVPRLRTAAMSALARTDELATTPGEQALMRRTRSGLNSFFAEYDHMTQGDPKRAEYSKTLKLIDSVMQREVLEPTREYLRLNEGMLAKANEENQRIATRLTTGLIGLGICGAIGGLLAGWTISAVHRRNRMQTEDRLRFTARQLDEAARIRESAPKLNGREVDALGDVAKSAQAVLSRLKRTEQEALRAEQLAWAGQMAAGIAHEVRNPLMAIKLVIQALAEGRGGNHLRPRDISVLEEEIVRLESIINSFLDFARPPRLTKRPVEIGPLVEQVAAGIHARADLQGIEIQTSLPRIPVVVEADENQLRQLLYNLGLNGIDAQPSGGQLRIAVEVERPDPAVPPMLVIRVEDDGPGLPAHLGERIFEPFVSSKESGMGLGLSICRRIVESHGGEISAAHHALGGAVFTVRIPSVLTDVRAEASLSPEGRRG